MVARLTEERLQREGAILSDPTSPGEAAISKEAAAWAVELHSTPGDLQHKFRIVHASVALIGYGCPPEVSAQKSKMHSSMKEVICKLSLFSSVYNGFTR